MDSELDNVLTAVKARSAQHHRSRQVLVAGGTIAVVLCLVLVVARAGSNRDRTLDVATPGTATTTTSAKPDSTVQDRINDGTTTVKPTENPGPTIAGTTSFPILPPTTTIVVDTRKPPLTTPTSNPPYVTLTLPHPIPTPPTTPPPARPGVAMSLADAKAVWAANRPAKYKMTIKRSCFCPQGWLGPFTIIVEGNTIVTPAGDEMVKGLTVDDLYAQAAGIGSGGRIVELLVDPEFGYPVSMSLDQITAAVDDEVGYSVAEFGAV